MILYACVLGSLTLAYIFVLSIFRKGLRVTPPSSMANEPMVSVIVAARNEEHSIANCLTAILKQSYPRDKFEILVMDDRSTDRTAPLVADFAQSDRRIRLIRIGERSPRLSPKKHAIDLGIRQAHGEIIFTTDADCLPGSEWISEMIKYFTPGIGMVAGYNPYQTPDSPNSLFTKMLALDYFAMACVAAASAGLGYPISCSGGNLAYRRQLYLAMGGFHKHSRWVSGDDDFFLERIRESSDWGVAYATNSKTFVPTAPPQSISSFVQQRIRYASKCAHYSPPVTIALIGVYFLNLSILAGTITTIWKPALWPIWSTAFILKTFFEHRFLAGGQKVFQTRHPFYVFLAASLLHPIYIVALGLLGRFANFKWKGETHAARIPAHSEYQSKPAGYELS